MCRFAAARAPGIYKDDYIQGLFRYYHEQRLDSGPGATPTPLMPAWKPDEGSPEHFLATEDAADEAAGGDGAGARLGGPRASSEAHRGAASKGLAAAALAPRPWEIGTVWPCAVAGGAWRVVARREVVCGG